MLVDLLRRDRIVIVGGLLGIIVLSWAYLLAGAEMDMETMSGMLMPRTSPVWTPGYFALTLTMWAVMMAAMMLPSASPMLLLYEKIARARGEDSRTIGPTSLFGLGYFFVWAEFCVAAVALQYGLDKARLLSPMMETTSVGLAGALLVLAGLYQWTPLKQTCLRHCRSPLEFITTQWRGGSRGAFTMGLRHGVFCLGCCWVLMLLLFVGGVMNVVWIAGIAAFVLVEKTAPAGPWLGRIVGVALVAWGGATLFWLA